MIANPGQSLRHSRGIFYHSCDFEGSGRGIVGQFQTSGPRGRGAAWPGGHRPFVRGGALRQTSYGDSGSDGVGTRGDGPKLVWQAGELGGWSHSFQGSAGFLHRGRGLGWQVSEEEEERGGRSACATRRRFGGCLVPG